MTDSRIGVVIITHQRRTEALDAVTRLTALPEQPPIVLVDNGSTDGTANAVRQRFPQIDVIALTRNEGAAGRNLGVEHLHTPYVAFCDDVTWWEPGSLTEAADVLDAHPRLGAESVGRHTVES
jgi:GT2 family glycosyltransferase